MPEFLQGICIGYFLYPTVNNIVTGLIALIKGEK
jgi:hypothetical protein